MDGGMEWLCVVVKRERRREIDGEKRRGIKDTRLAFLQCMHACTLTYGTRKESEEVDIPCLLFETSMWFCIRVGLDRDGGDRNG